MKRTVRMIFLVVMMVFVFVSAGGIIAFANNAPQVTRYEAETGTLTGCSVKNSYGAFSGEGFVGNIDETSSKVELTVNVPQDGEYAFNISYATGAANSTIKLYTAAGIYNELACGVVEAWGDFDKTPVLQTGISLRAGSSVIALGKAAGYFELDYVEICDRIGEFKETQYKPDRDLSDVTSGFTRYELEDAVLTKCETYEEGSVFSGRGYIGGFDFAQSKASITVTAAQEGEYKFILAYAIGTDFKAATVKVHNNEGYYATLKCNKILGWGSFSWTASVEATVSLRAGENTISITRGSNYFQADFIELGPRIGDYRPPATEGTGGPPVQEGYTRYETEDGIVVNAICKGMGFVNDYGNGEYSGLGFVGSFDNADCYVDIPVTVAESGMYEVVLRYATANDSATAKIYSGRYGKNGYLYYYNSVSCIEASDWGDFTDEAIGKVSVGLQAGENFIRIKAGENFFEADYIDVSGKIDEYEKGIVEVSASDGYNEFEDGIFDGKIKDDGYRMSSKLNGGAIAAIIIASTAAAAGCAVAAILVTKKLRRKKNEKE